MIPVVTFGHSLGAVQPTAARRATKFWLAIHQLLPFSLGSGHPATSVSTSFSSGCYCMIGSALEISWRERIWFWKTTPAYFAMLELKKQAFTCSLNVPLAKPAGTLFQFSGIWIYHTWTWSLMLKITLAATSLEKFASQHAGFSGSLGMELSLIVHRLTSMLGREDLKKSLVLCVLRPKPAGNHHLCGEIATWCNAFLLFWAWLPCSFSSCFSFALLFLSFV